MENNLQLLNNTRYIRTFVPIYEQIKTIHWPVILCTMFQYRCQSWGNRFYFWLISLFNISKKTTLCPLFIYGDQLPQRYGATMSRQFNFWHSVPRDTGTHLTDLKRMKVHCVLTTRPFTYFSLITRLLLPNILPKRLLLR